LVRAAVEKLEHFGLPDELGNVWQKEKLPVTVRARIMEKLTKLYNLDITQ
jgi:hypothetical protein